MEIITDERKSLYTIRVAAELSGVSPGTIREYERQGLLRVHRDPNSRHRLFSALEIDWVRQIWHLIHEEHLNVEGIRRLLTVVPCFKIAKCSQEMREACHIVREEYKPCWASNSPPLCCAESGRICQACEVYTHSQQNPVLVPKG